MPIGASIGVATFPADGRTATELIAAADRALYQVKRGGGHDAAAAVGRRRLIGRAGRSTEVPAPAASTSAGMDADAVRTRHPLFPT